MLRPRMTADPGVVLTELHSLIEKRGDEIADITPEEKEISDKAKELLPELERVTDETPTSEFNPEKLAEKFPGFSVYKVVADDKTRDEFYGPVTGVDAVKHQTPSAEKDIGLHRVAHGGRGILKRKQMREEKADYVLFRGKDGLYLRWRIIGNHAKADKPEMMSVLWLFYLHKPA